MRFSLLAVLFAVLFSFSAEAAAVKKSGDIAYGPDPAQAMDVYYPEGASGAPVIFMVHGGGWQIGDKGSDRVVENKINRWVPKGFILISTNYRMPKGDVFTQRDDVRAALIFAQKNAEKWGGDPSKFILMGHSAGAHLVSLIAADPQASIDKGAQRWLGAIALDSAALDLVGVMAGRHSKIFDEAFGGNKNDWAALSPYHNVTAAASPWLGVCSSARKKAICAAAREYAARLKTLGVKAETLPQALSHADININLGLDGLYTARIEGFMAGLDPEVAQRL